MKKLILLFVAAFILAGTANIAGADSTFATSVVGYSSAPAPPPPAGIFMNWDNVIGFRHNEVPAYPGAGADLDWLLGPVDQTVAAGWGGDANGGYLILSYNTAFQADGAFSADIIVYGFGFAYNTPFSLEKGAIRVSASGNGSDWTVISDYAGYSGGGTWEANPDFSQSPPGVPSIIMRIDLDDAISNLYSDPISYLKFELGDGTEGHGRAFFVNAVEGTNAYQHNNAPTADAGPDQPAAEGDMVTLNGSGSFDPDPGDTLTYQWTQTDSTGLTVTLSDDTAVSPTFTAPAVSADGIVLEFELAVTDSGGLTDTDTVRVDLIFENQQPTADAGPDQTAAEGDMVTLNGSGSFDPDPGDTLSYHWTQTDSTGLTVTLSDDTAASPTFTAPAVSADGIVLEFELTVTDSGGLTDTDTVRVGLIFENQPPNANAGSDQTAAEGDMVTLNGSGSFDPDPGDTLSYHWTQTDSTGLTVTLSDDTAVSPTFTAPAVSADGIVLEFELAVTDSGGLTDTDTVRVGLIFENQPPNANAGSDQTAAESDMVTLNGSGSFDPDPGDTLTYQWTQTDSTGLTVTLSDDTAASPTFTAPDVDSDGIVLEFELTVTDTGGLAHTDSVVINVADKGADGADSIFATSVVDYSSAPAPPPAAGIFMNWDSTNGFYHNEVPEYPGAGADLDWLLGPVDETVAAGWGGDANGGYITFEFAVPFAADRTAAADIVVHGFGYAYNTPFSAEKGAIRIYASDNGVDWTVISDYAGYDNGATWEANPDFSESPPGIQAAIMAIDLDDGESNPYSGPISYLKFELGDGTEGHGRAFFVNAVECGQINVGPVATAGPDQEVNPDAVVTLDASGSSDMDDGIASYQWVQKDATPSTTVTLDDPTAIFPTFRAPDAPGETLTFELTVTDNAGQTDTDTVEISIAMPAFDITMYYATSVEDESGCVSWSEQTADGGEHALGLPDYVPDSEGDCSGWMENAGHITLKFKGSITDGDGRDDLIIFHFGQGEAEVSVSEDGVAWTSLGALPAAEDGGGILSHISYNFSDSGVSSVQYVKILKTGTGQKFIDSVFVPVSVYGAFAEDRDADYPDGCVDWVAKQADDGQNALEASDYDDSTPGIGNCSGWMVEAGRLTIGFDKPFFDGKGNDLAVYHFGRGGANVEVSRDGATWISLGELPAGLNGGSRLDAAGYNFSDFGITWVQYVRINKTQVGFTYGRFIDAVEGVYGIPGSVGAAGRDQTVVEGTTVILGAPEEDGEDGNASYEWEQIDGPAVTLSDEFCRNPAFIAPMTDDEGVVLKFKLVKTDDSGGTEEDEVQIKVVDNGFQLSATQDSLFAEADFVFNNRVGTNRNGGETCYMGMACEEGSLTYYEARDPDSKLSSDYIEDMSNRPKNLIYGLIAFDVKLSQGSDLAVVTIFLPEPASAEYKWYKYSKTRGWFDFSRDMIPGGTGDGAEFNHDRTQVILHITDGGDYDDDGIADGHVKDPSGLGDSTTVGSWHDQDGGDSGCFIASSARVGSLTGFYVIFAFIALLVVVATFRLRVKASLQ